MHGRRRMFCTAHWPNSTWGETDRHDGWQGSNWAANIRWTNSALHEPSSVEEVSRIVRAASKVRVVGSAHSFTPLVATDNVPTTLLSLRKMPAVCQLDKHAATITVDAGATYSELCNYLSTTDYALP